VTASAKQSTAYLTLGPAAIRRSLRRPSDPSGTTVPATLALSPRGSDGVPAGAVGGAASGVVASAVAGSLMPAVGTVLGGIGGAALGAAGGTFLGPFLAMDIAEEDANHYSNAANQGRTLVIVRQMGRSDEARAILREHGGLELPEYLANDAKR
jgi:hypothetical protein